MAVHVFEVVSYGLQILLLLYPVCDGTWDGHASTQGKDWIW